VTRETRVLASSASEVSIRASWPAMAPLRGTVLF